ncbi:hypothetical protein BX589_15317 [Paraburkholderia fungorum]|jgi:hypothetical protein|nr:hypothetical protein BX589_15317 [Paraburkholderia fungorum]
MRSRRCIAFWSEINSGEKLREKTVAYSLRIIMYSYFDSAAIDYQIVCRFQNVPIFSPVRQWFYGRP